jgi:ubiquinone/menaquinone biosynthesis C-methylase UbiE
MAPPTAYFRSLNGRDVLEVGCGSGFASQMFAEAGARVTAVDLTEWAVANTRRRLQAFGLAADVFEGDAESLPFEDASFDPVFSWGVIHHSTDMDAALRELVRVCRPGGRVVIMVYHRRSLFFQVYPGLQRFLPVARRLGFGFEGRASVSARASSRAISRAPNSARSSRTQTSVRSASFPTARTTNSFRSRAGFGFRSPSAFPAP